MSGKARAADTQESMWREKGSTIVFVLLILFSSLFFRFFLYLRLFIVMGVFWIIEIISWALYNSFVLHVFDILNCLQGFIIFFMFVWKAKVKKMILRR